MDVCAALFLPTVVRLAAPERVEAEPLVVWDRDAFGFLGTPIWIKNRARN
jgi:hypothetical protein